jgi:hypothetical protein
MSLIGLVVFLILVGLACWVISTLAPVLGIPAPIVTVLYVILVVIVVLWLLQTFVGITGGPVLRFRS